MNRKSLRSTIVQNCISMSQIFQYLSKDAFDIACRAYLYQQQPNGKQIPIRFCSKKFSATERRWDIPQHKEEAYALYYGVMQFEYLLRDSNIIVNRTDHKNLVSFKYQYERQEEGGKMEDRFAIFRRYH